MEAAIVDAAADIEELLGNLMVDILKLCINVKSCMLLHKLHHILILLILNIITGELFQAALSDGRNHVLDIGVDGQSGLALNDSVLDLGHIFIHGVIRLLIINASFQGCNGFVVIRMTVIVQIAYSLQNVI